MDMLLETYKLKHSVSSAYTNNTISGSGLDDRQRLSGSRI